MVRLSLLSRAAARRSRCSLMTGFIPVIQQRRVHGARDSGHVVRGRLSHGADAPLLGCRNESGNEGRKVRSLPLPTEQSATVLTTGACPCRA